MSKREVICVLEGEDYWAHRRNLIQWSRELQHCDRQIRFYTALGRHEGSVRRWEKGAEKWEWELTH